jgi:hypothetical protein
MARLMFAVFAERVTADRFTNTLDVLNVLEKLHVPEPPREAMAKARTSAQKRYPAIALRFALLTHWRRTNVSKAEGRLRQRVELLSPFGSVLGSSITDFTLRDSEYVRNVTQFAALPVAGEGSYTARISLLTGRRWRRVGETSFELAYLRIASGEKIRVH